MEINLNNLDADNFDLEKFKKFDNWIVGVELNKKKYTVDCDIEIDYDLSTEFDERGFPQYKNSEISTVYALVNEVCEEDGFICNFSGIILSQIESNIEKEIKG